MFSYEFTGIDVLSEARKLMQNATNRSKHSISEEISSRSHIQNFTASFMYVPESSLILDNQYFHSSIVVNIEEKNIIVIMTVKPARYLSIAGSRLIFQYDSSSKPIFFPSDDYVIEADHRFIFESKDEIDMFVTQFIMKFSNSAWTYHFYGLDDSAKLQPLAIK